MQNDIDIVKFEKDVLQFNMIETQIKMLKKKMEPLQQFIKKLKQEKQIVQSEICKTMNKYGIDACNLPKDSEGIVPGTIKYSTSTLTAPLTRDLMKEILIDFFNKDTRVFDCMKNSEKGLYLYNYMISKENRPIINKETVKKVKYVDQDLDITQQYIIDEFDEPI